MTGLRHRKKEQARRQIIDSAARLFAAGGIASTTMDEIAAAADVSVATLYNYFGSKTALLLAAAEEDTNAMLEEGATVLARPGSHPAKAVKRLLDIYLTHFTGWDRELLRQMMAAMFEPGGDELAGGIAQLDRRLFAQLATLLRSLQERGALHPKVDPLEAVGLLFSVMITQLIAYLSLEGVGREELSAQLARQIDIAFVGLAVPKESKR